MWMSLTVGYFTQPEPNLAAWKTYGTYSCLPAQSHKRKENNKDVLLLWPCKSFPDGNLLIFKDEGIEKDLRESSKIVSRSLKILIFLPGS